MVSILFEIGFELVKKLYRFLGPALFLIIAAVVGVIMIPGLTDNKAYNSAVHSEMNEVLSFDEVRYDKDTRSRVFRAELRNTGADSRTYGILYITNEDGKDIFNSIKTQFDDLRIGERHASVSYIPPGGVSVVEIWIDDYKLKGLDHVYIADVYSEQERGKRFDIEVKG